MFARFADQPFVADATVGSADAGAYSERAAAQIADSGDDFGFDEAVAANSGSSGSSTSRCSPGAAARTDRGAFAPVYLAPEPIKLKF